MKNRLETILKELKKQREELQTRVDDLMMLLAAYRSGAVREGHDA